MGRRSIAVVAALLGALAAIAACTPFSAADDPALDAADGASDDALDAASEADAEAALDADGGVGCAPLEGGFCASQSPAPAFCADFDNPLCPLLGFASLSRDPRVSVDFATAHKQSAPASLHITQAQGAAQTAAWGPVTSFVIPSNAATTTIRIDLEYRVPALPTGAGPPRLGPIHLDATKSGGPSVDFFVESDKSYFVIGASYYSADGPATTTNTWRSVSFTFAIEPNGSSAFTGTFEQAAAPLFVDHPLTPSMKAGQTVTMTVGYDAFELTQGETYVDNVVVRITP